MKSRKLILAALAVALLCGNLPTRTASAALPATQTAFNRELVSFIQYLILKQQFGLYATAYTAGTTAAQQAGSNPYVVKYYDGLMGSLFDAAAASTDTTLKSKFATLDTKYAAYRADLLAQEAATQLALKTARDLANTSRRFVTLRGLMLVSSQSTADRTKVVVMLNGAHFAGAQAARGATGNQYWVKYYEGVIQSLQNQVNALTVPAGVSSTTVKNNWLNQINDFKAVYNVFRSDLGLAPLP